MAMWTACIYVYWRAETAPSFWRVIACGVVYGLTLDTKHNAWMLPAVFVVHAMVAHGRSISRTASRSSKIPIPASLVSMATLGPAVFFLLWPWMWPIAKAKDGWDTNVPLTMARIQEYVNFHVNHEYYNIEFLGHTYFGPPSPRLYMPLMILATVPTVTLVLFAVGAIDRLKVLALRIVSLLAPRGADAHGSGLGRWRYVVERTLACFSHFRRLRLCYERDGMHFQAFHDLAACLLVCSRLKRARA